MEYTLSYSEQVQGWPSFYSFIPEWMIGMNNYFYTFKGGNLYRHNVNTKRNTFYQEWWIQVDPEHPEYAFTPSKLKSVINDAPLENKLFKTIALQGDDTWSANLSTDIPLTGYIEADWFEKKEQAWFGFIRDTGTVPADPTQYPQRSVNGIGACSNVSGLTSALKVEFSISPVLVSIGAIISIGDYVYTLSSGTPVLAGKVTDINQNYRAGNNYLIIDSTVAGATPPVATDYIMFIKSSVAESHGLLGHYLVFEVENTNTNKVELFQVQSNVMKSFP